MLLTPNSGQRDWCGKEIIKARSSTRSAEVASRSDAPPSMTQRRSTRTGRNITGTRIYVGSVSGASFVNEATDCFIHLQSHQIRIHNSKRVHFYLTARSNPIIEHCSEM